MTAELITKSLFSSVVVIFQNFHSFVIKTRVRLNKIQAFLFTIFFTPLLMQFSPPFGFDHRQATLPFSLIK
jgi:hypothetical protein